LALFALGIIFEPLPQKLNREGGSLTVGLRKAFHKNMGEWGLDDIIERVFRGH
jgi:hypothetical protein